MDLSHGLQTFIDENVIIMPSGSVPPEVEDELLNDNDETNG
jgi:hypothetical protein